MTTPSSSIDLTSQSVPHLSLSFLCWNLFILDKLRIEMTRDSSYHAGKKGGFPMGRTCIILLRMESFPVWRISMEILSSHSTSTSLVVLIRAYKRLNIFAILSIASFLLDLNIKHQRYMNPLHASTSSLTILGNVLNNHLYLMTNTTLAYSLY